MSRDTGVTFNKSVSKTDAQKPTHTVVMGGGKATQTTDSDKSTDFRAQITTELQKQYGKKDNE